MKIMYWTIVLLIIFIETCTGVLCTDMGAICVYSDDCCVGLACFWVNIDGTALSDSSDYGIYDEKRCFPTIIPGEIKKCKTQTQTCSDDRECCHTSGLVCNVDGRCKSTP
eukprot:227461_1